MWKGVDVWIPHEGFVENFDHSSQLLFVFKSVGDICTKMLGLASGIEKFVWGESGPQEVDKQDYINNKSVSSSFVAGTQNLLYFHLSLLKSDRELFRDFNDFTLKCGKVIATVLSSSSDICQKCGRKLVFENKAIPVVIYSNHQGTYLGSRLTKLCRKCKFTNTMDTGLLTVNNILTGTLYSQSFVFHLRTLLSRWIFWLNVTTCLSSAPSLSVHMQLVTIDVSSIVNDNDE